MHPFHGLKSSLCAAALSALCLPPVHAAAVPGQGTWETTLQARDINHDGTVDAYYDTALDVSWLACIINISSYPSFRTAPGRSSR